MFIAFFCPDFGRVQDSVNIIIRSKKSHETDKTKNYIIKNMCTSIGKNAENYHLRGESHQIIVLMEEI